MRATSLLAGRGALLLALLLLLSPREVTARDEPQERPTALTTFRAEVTKLTLAWKGILRETGPLRKKLEEKRAACRRDERARTPTPEQRAWPARWEATAGDRMRLHNIIFPHFLGWTTPLLALLEAHDAKPLTPQTLAQVSKVAAERVQAWVSVGEVDTLRGLLETAPDGILRVLALPGRPHARRALLGAVAARTAATPGRSDVDALRAVVSWEGLFAAAGKPAAQIDLVSRDLVLLFTERKEDGIAKSDGRYYVAGRFRDRGFAKRYRDGSDQVRHFAWAFRMFAASEKSDAVARLLQMKEAHDARTRKHPLNEADVALNAAARLLVAKFRGQKEGSVAIDVRSWPELLAEHLAAR